MTKSNQALRRRSIKRMMTGMLSVFLICLASASAQEDVELFENAEDAAPVPVNQT